MSLVGCSSGSVVPAAARPTTAPVTSAAASSGCQPVDNTIAACTRLGDFSTLDPCGLISVGQLPADLVASPASRDSLDNCEFDITAGSDKGATLEVGELASTEEDHAGNYDAGTEALGRNGLELYEGTLGDGECDDAVMFDGDLIEMDVSVFTTHGDGSQALCDAANEVGKALGTVLAGRTQLPHFTVPANSLAKVRACGLANGAQIGSYQIGTEQERPAGHHCWWVPDLSDASVQFGLNLEIGTDVDANAADVRSQIDGLESYTLKDSEAGYARCEVDTNRIPWGSASSGLLEIASVWAEQPAGRIGTACSLATDLADVVWPKLPPLS